MDHHDLILRLSTVASKARNLQQHEAAQEIEALVIRLSSKYYFLVNPGGYGTKIPDQEYREFPDEQSVIQYVQQTILSEETGRKPGENEGLQRNLDFDNARRVLLEVGEFGPLGTPLTPPDAMVGSFHKEALDLDVTKAISKLKSSMDNFPTTVQGQVQKLIDVVTTGQLEVVGGVQIDVETASIALKFLAVINPAFASAALAMGVLNLVHQIYTYGADYVAKALGALESVGEYFTGETQTASADRYADMETVKEEVEERLDKWKYDPGFQDLLSNPRFINILYKVIEALSYEGRSRLLAEALPAMIDKAMGAYRNWKQEGEGQEFEAFVASRESTFFKVVEPPKLVREEWEKDLKRYKR